MVTNDFGKRVPTPARSHSHLQNWKLEICSPKQAALLTLERDHCTGMIINHNGVVISHLSIKHLLYNGESEQRTHLEGGGVLVRETKHSNYLPTEQTHTVSAADEFPAAHLIKACGPHKNAK